MSPLVKVASLLLLVHTATSTSTPTIQAPWGSIQGVGVQGDEGRMMDGYLGIPYAVPPVGELRFERPLPHPGPGQHQVFVADQLTPACPQIPILLGSAREKSEDCLTLNVYTPPGAQSSPTPHAVMIFIHGGGFTMGDAPLFRPSKLVVDGEVIVVTIQYRLGALGFLSSGDDTLPGNMGLWDQHLAIRWVKDNIPHFGGDADRITIFGESAGSMSVGLQLFSPKSRGLFKRAVMQSGSPQDIVKVAEVFESNTIFKGVAALFDCQGDSSEELLQCLKEQPAADIFNKTTDFSVTSPFGNYFFPVVDGEFIPRPLKELMQDEQYVKDNLIGDIDVMTGFNNKEGALVLILLQVLQLPPEAMYSADFFGNIMSMCMTIHTWNPQNLVLRKTIDFFYRGADAGTNKSVSVDAMTNMYGDCILGAPIVECTGQLAAMPHSAAHYLYVMDHDFDFNNRGPIPGSHHGDEQMLQFDNDVEYPEDSLILALGKTGLAEEEKPLSAQFVQIFTAFAKTGDPNPAVRDDLGADWPQFTPETESYLSFSKNLRVVNAMGPYRNRGALWRQVLPELNALTPQPPPAEEKAEEESVSKEEL